METISVGEMMVNGAPIEGQVLTGESFDVVNLGRPTVHMVAAALRRVLKWDDHLAAAIPARGHSAEETIGADRDGRFSAERPMLYPWAAEGDLTPRHHGTKLQETKINDRRSHGAPTLSMPEA